MGFAVEEKLQASVSRRDSDNERESGLTPNGQEKQTNVQATVHTISNDQAETTR